MARAPGEDREPAADAARLDQWLWAARFFKTRALATQGIEGGKVLLNDAKPRRAHPVRVGDAIRIRQGPYEYHLTVTAIARRRGSAAVAAGLYQEDPAGREARERLAEQHRLAARIHGEPARRPGKKDRRDLQRWKDQR